MGVAIAAITLGAWFAYSALKGQSLTDVFKGGGATLDPSGNVTVASAEAATGVTPANVGDITGATGGDNLSRMYAEMNRMVALKQPYKWGGGHASFSADGPWDCSGAVSQLMHVMGFMSGRPMVSGEFALRWGDHGEGKVFTVWANPIHVFIIMHQGPHAGEAWGTTSRLASQGGSLQWHHHPTAGFTPRHWSGW